MSRCIVFGGAEKCGNIDICSDDYIIAADGGYRHCAQMNIKPNLLIGDFDSLKEPLPDNIPIIQVPSEKDDTDSMLAVKKGMERGCTEFVLTGVTGGRMGHTLASLGTLEYIHSRNCSGYIDDGNRIYLQSTGTNEYHNDNYRYVSIISLTDEAVISIDGLKYSGEKIRLSRDFPLGVSNEFIKQKCNIAVESGKILVILEK